jgi:WD40 repeat protein
MSPFQRKQMAPFAGLQAGLARAFALTGLLIALQGVCWTLPFGSAQAGQVRGGAAQVDVYGDALPAGALARMGTLRFWIGPPITSIAFAPDGKTLAAAADYGSLSVPIWDANTGRVIRVLQGPSDVLPEDFMVRDVAFAQADNLIATLNGDDTARVWEPTTGRTIRAFRLFGEDAPFRTCFGPDGKTLLSIGATVGLWDLRTGETTRRFEVPTAVLSRPSLALSPNGSIVAAAYDDQTIRLWDATTGKITRRLADPGLVCPNAFSADGRSLASVGRDGTIKTWEVSTGNLLRTSAFGSGKIAGGISLSPGHTLAAAGASDGTIRLVQVATGMELLRIQLEPREIAHTLAFSPDGKAIASASGTDAVVQLWDATSGREASPYPRHRGRVLSIAFSPDDRTLASAGTDGSLRLWDVATGKEIRRILDPPLRSRDEPSPEVAARTVLGRVGPRGSLVFGPGGEALITVTNDGTVSFWYPAATKDVRRTTHEGAGRINAVAFDPTGKLIAAAGPHNALMLWDVASGTEVRRTATGHKESIYAMAFSPDGGLIASAGDGGVVMLWTTSTLRPVRRFLGSRETILAVGFSRDGKMICAGGLDSVLSVWDLQGAEVQRSQASNQPEEHAIRAVSFSPDGNLIAWAGDDHLVRVWSTRKRTAVAEFRGHRGDVNQVAFSGNSHLLASASDDGTILVWDASDLGQ